MSILQMPVSDVGGIGKRLDEAALPLIFDNLQKSQYNYPIPSTIRELVCNAVDSIEERKMAVQILSGAKKVSDYYVEREGDIYRDSRFKADYYKPEWLEQHNDTVEIIYHSNGNLEKDFLSITDHGVGLGGNRLVGYFRLGYSTKRLSTFGIGKYGIGAKAPLSAATFYTVDSYYNGRHYRFNVYSYQVQSIVPAFNQDGTPTPFEFMDMGGGEEKKVHYWDTTHKNGVTITVESKKHHREKYIQAIKNQLLYFSNVAFEIHHENGRVEKVPLTAPILYEDDYIILADNHYVKPHVLIKRVNYGYIDFQELELDDKLGNIGIKVEAEEVDVTPSRESIQWTETTRDTIKAKFERVVEVSQNLLNLEMNETDFLKWFRKCATLNALLTRKEVNDPRLTASIVGRLAGIVDLSQLSISFAPDPEIKYKLGTFHGVPIRKVSLKLSRTNNKDNVKVESTQIKSLMDIAQYPFVLVQDKLYYTRTRYLLETYFPDGFIAFFTTKLMGATDELDTEKETEEVASTVTAEMLFSPEELARVTKLRKYLTESSEAQVYEAFQIPEGLSYRKRKGDSKEEEDVEEEEARVSRREKGDTPFYYLMSKGKPYHSDSLRTVHEWNRAAISKSEINSWENEETFYGFVNTGDERLLEICALISRRRHNLWFDTLETLQKFSKPEDKLGMYGSGNNYKSVWSHMAAYYGPRHKDIMAFEGTIGNHVPTSTALQDLGYDKLTDAAGTYESPYRVLFGVNNHNSDPVRLIRISKSNVRYYRNFRHVHYFFRDVRKINGKNTITMSNALVRWNTARVIKGMIDKIKFYNNFEHEPELRRRYRTLREYVDKYYREISGQVMFNNELGAASNEEVQKITEHCDKIMELQLFVQENPDASDAVVAKMARGLFGTVQTRFGTEVEVQSAWAVDIGLYADAKMLFEAGQDIAPLLNEVKCLVSGNSIPLETYEAIQDYLAYKQFQSPLNKNTCSLPSTETETLSPAPVMESLSQ